MRVKDDIRNWSIHVGEHDRLDTGVGHNASCLHVPDEYDPYTYPSPYDVALITLREPVDITSSDSKARLACLPQTDRTYEGKDMTVSGWGVTEAFVSADQNAGTAYLNFLHHRISEYLFLFNTVK